MSRLAIIFLVLVMGCGSPKTDDGVQSSPEAVSIVTRSIQKHGGQDYWEKLETISYNKITILFDSTGAQELSTVQKHEYNLKPSLSATIKWIENGDSVRIEFKENSATRFVNNVADPDAAEASRNLVNAALYVLFQPFKLLDPGTTLLYQGKDSLDDKTVNMVRPTYKGAKEGDDEWFFYFDASSDELIANMVNHNGKRSLIKNLAFDYTSPLTLHQQRMSYFVDSALNIQYLRAQYFYTNYNLTFSDPVDKPL